MRKILLTTGLILLTTGISAYFNSAQNSWYRASGVDAPFAVQAYFECIGNLQKITCEESKDQKAYDKLHSMSLKKATEFAKPIANTDTPKGQIKNEILVDNYLNTLMIKEIEKTPYDYWSCGCNL